MVRDLGRALVGEAAGEQDRVPARVRVGVAAPTAAGTCGMQEKPQVVGVAEAAQERGVAALVVAVQEAPAAEGEEQATARVAARAAAEVPGRAVVAQDLVAAEGEEQAPAVAAEWVAVQASGPGEPGLEELAEVAVRNLENG